MALSIKTFGLKVISVRIPSILLGSLIVPIIYNIAQEWLKDRRVSYFATLLYTFSFYQIELTTGRIALDHNDVIFQFFVIASIWAFVRFNVTKANPLLWSIIIGILSGGAILTKWLVGLVVYFGWTLHIIAYRKYSTIKYLSLSLLITAAISLPWQLYILHEFPSESSATYNIFYKHITESLGTNVGNSFYHLLQLNNIYDYVFIPFIIWGIYVVIRNKSQNTVPLLSIIGVVYVFFSLSVKTKMPSFTTIVSPLIWILIAVGLSSTIEKATANYKNKNLVLAGAAIIFTIISLKPWDIIHHRTDYKKDRVANVYNSNIYKNLNIEHDPKNIVINCKAFDNIDIMFHQDITAYPRCPDKSVIDSLTELGFRFYAFDSHDEYPLPEAIRNHPDVTIIDGKLK